MSTFFQRPSAPRLAHLIPLALVLASMAGTVDAQQPWNRRVAEIAMVPAPTPTEPTRHEIHVVWRVGLGQPNSIGLDLSTEVMIMRNGVPLETKTTDIMVNPGGGFCSPCSGGCGEGIVNGLAATLFCVDSNGCGCDFLPFTSSSAAPLAPGDEIMVLLRPSPGAAPDGDQSDDVMARTYDGTPVFWDRRIRSLDVVPSPGAGDGIGDSSFFDVWIEWDVATSGIFATHDITPSFEVQVNGDTAAIFELPCGPWILNPGNNCAIFCDNSICASISCSGHGTKIMRCQFYEFPGYDGCACQPENACLEIIPGLALVPEDEVVVILKPVPGALPELPGFGENDQEAEGAWRDMGHALAGTHGDPAAVGNGTLVGGTPVMVSLLHARENSTAYLVVGVNAVFAPFKGGMLVPDPNAPGFFVALPTGPIGVIDVPGVWPLGLPAGFSVFFQWWIQDPAGPVDFAASNALSATTP